MTAPSPGALGPRPGKVRVLLQGLWAGPVLAMVGAVAFSGKAIIVKLAYRHGVDAVTLIMLRMAVALPFFLLMVWWAGRGRPALPLRDKLTAAALGYGGLLLVFGHELTLDGPRVALGTALVLASTLSCAGYLLYSGEVVRRIGSLRLTGWASSVACVLCLGQFALLRPIGGLVDLPRPVVWLSLVNGTLCTVLPVLLVMMAIERIGSARAAQYGMVGPITTIALGVLILGEPFTAWVAAGTLCVLASVALLARSR